MQRSSIKSLLISFHTWISWCLVYWTSAWLGIYYYWLLITYCYLYLEVSVDIHMYYLVYNCVFVCVVRLCDKINSWFFCRLLMAARQKKLLNICHYINNKSLYKCSYRITDNDVNFSSLLIIFDFFFKWFSNKNFNVILSRVMDNCWWFIIFDYSKC